MTAPEVLVAEVLVAEARGVLLNGSVFRVERAETAPGGVKAVTADGVEFPTGRGLYAISEVTPSCGHRRMAGPPGLLGGLGASERSTPTGRRRASRTGTRLRGGQPTPGFIVRHGAGLSTPWPPSRLSLIHI